jgi:hypothetical protein
VIGGTAQATMDFPLLKHTAPAAIAIRSQEIL